MSQRTDPPANGLGCAGQAAFFFLGVVTLFLPFFSSEVTSGSEDTLGLLGRSWPIGALIGSLGAWLEHRLKWRPLGREQALLAGMIGVAVHVWADSTTLILVFGAASGACVAISFMPLFLRER